MFLLSEQEYSNMTKVRYIQSYYVTYHPVFITHITDDIKKCELCDKRIIEKSDYPKKENLKIGAHSKSSNFHVSSMFCLNSTKGTINRIFHLRMHFHRQLRGLARFCW